jgi:hypothetical protein
MKSLGIYDNVMLKLTLEEGVMIKQGIIRTVHIACF